MLILLCLFSVFQVLATKIHDAKMDKIKNFPGIDIKNLSIYSGYLPIYETGRFMHYVFVESENDPYNDPVVLWLNGGPGCSSLEGLFTEIGPFVFQPENGKKLKFNKWRWNKATNLIFFESPTIIGFSINPKGVGQFNYSDISTAQDNYAALVSFFNFKFPNLKKNKFWLAGESYAGIYIPTLAYLIDKNLGDFKINFQGMMIGNGIHDKKGVIQSNVEYLSKRNLIQRTLEQKYQLFCVKSFQKSTCKKVIDKIIDLTEYVNPYNIYGYCWSQSQQSSKKPKMGIQCTYTDNLQRMLNNDEVKAALNVVSNIHWVQCLANKKSHYQQSPSGITEQLKSLLGKYNLLLYNGDADSVVSYLNIKEQVIKSLDLKSTSVYNSYIVDESEQLTGFVQKFEKRVIFATIRGFILKINYQPGAGHMVPQSKRQASFYIFNQTINGHDL